MNQAEEYIRRILKVLVYIENHLDEDISIEKLSKIACYSPFHFQKIFTIVANETVYAYIKRLRMQIAAGQLRYTKKTITEIALDTNFETPSGFTKAFTQFMGSSPTNYRSLNSAIDSITEKIEALPMITPEKIEKNLPSLNLLFVRKYGSYDKSPEIAWEIMKNFIHENNLRQEKIRYFGISHDDPNITSSDKLRYDAAIYTTSVIREKGEIAHQTLQGGRYAIFTHQGPYSDLDTVFNRIFIKWLPYSQEKFDESRPVFCEYFHIEYAKIEPVKLETKIYIPL